MSLTKGQVVRGAWGEMGMSKFPLTASISKQMLEKLDDMFASWSGESIRCGYNIETADTTNLNSTSGIPDIANEAAKTNLAVRSCRIIGKAIPPDLAANASAAKDKLENWCLANTIPDLKLTRQTPVGAGNKPYRYAGSGNYFPTQPDTLTAGQEQLTVNGGQPLAINNGSTSNPISGS